MDYETIKTWDLPEVVHAYDRKDTILYALGIGYGFDPLDERQLAFVYEEGLVAAPSMAAVLGHPGFWMRQPDTGIDWVKVLHAEQTLTLCAPLPVEGEVVGRTRVTAIVDKGPQPRPRRRRADQRVRADGLVTARGRAAGWRRQLVG